MRRFTLFICLFTLTIVTNCRLVHGQAVENAKGVPPTELARMVTRAGDEDMIVSGLKARLRGTRLLYDVEFEPNADNRQWLFRLNLTQIALKRFQKEATEKGFTEAIETSVRTSSGRRYSVIWVQGKAESQSLSLPDGPLPERGDTEERLAPIDKLLLSFLAEHNAAGCTMAISKDGDIVYSRGFGYADVETRRKMLPDTPMRIASVSKPMTATAVMILVQQRKLSLDDKVVSLLQRGDYPEPGDDVKERWSKVTVQHLLHHSAGWDKKVTKDPMFEAPEIIRNLKLRKSITPKDIVRYQLNQPIDFEPGSKYAYANFGYALLGRIIEIATDKPYAEAMKALILDPANMASSRIGRTKLEELGRDEARYHMQEVERFVPVWSEFERRSGRIQPPVAEPYGRWLVELMDAGGGWVSTAPDLVRFVNQLDAMEQPLVSEETRELIVTEPDFNDESYWYGCGWQVRRAGGGSDRVLGRHNIWHNGALAGTSTLLVRRYDGFAWAVLFNTDKSKDGQRLAGLIDGRIHRAVDSVEW